MNSPVITAAAGQTNTEFHVTIRDRSGVIVDTQATSVSTINQNGVFDILPLHGNLIALIAQKVRVVFVDGHEQEFPVDNGVIRVSENKLEVYIGVKR